MKAQQAIGALLFTALCGAPSGAQERSSAAVSERRTLAEGTPWETTALVRRAPLGGPTVVIVGGMHGNEPAGWRAARQIGCWPITRGALVVIPVANVGGVARSKRLTPGEPDFDLNRAFPSRIDGAIEGPLAEAIWALVSGSEPDWLVDLHESQGYHFETSKKGTRWLGHSLLLKGGDSARVQARKMIAVASAYVTSKKVRWRLGGTPIEGSLARAAASRLGCAAAISETCVKGKLARRVRYHRLMVHRLLSDLGMLPEGFSADRLLPARHASSEEDPLRVAIYNDTGAGGAGSIERCFAARGDMVTRRVTGAGVRAGALDRFDVVLFPGGSGSAQARSLKEPGRDRVKAFVERGGGYVGVCAGAYLVSRHYSWSLGLLNAKVVDTKHWARGSGDVEVALSAAARKFFGSEERLTIRYYQGPLLAHKEDGEAYEVLGEFATEIRKNESIPKGVMLGCHAVARAAFGGGRVFAFSPHPESRSEQHEMLRRASRWVARRESAGPKPKD